MGKTRQQLPSVAQLEAELKNEKHKRGFWRVFRNTIYSLITVSAAAVLLATLFLPILHIYGSSMEPILSEGNIVVAVKGNAMKSGDIIAFYFNNKILVKRSIAFSGDWVDIDAQGNVYVNSRLLEENYLYEKAFGECDIEFPHQVAENKVFVLGDNRATSIDSRNCVVGDIEKDQIVGEIVFRIWPFSKVGVVR